MSARDFTHIKLSEFQQPVNCCNLTAIAYALTALEYPTSLDEIFYVTRLPIASVLDDGMTLAETYDVCLKYVELMSLPVRVRVEHFDKPMCTVEWFEREIEIAVRDVDDVHVVNFSVAIAHDNANLRGGHFSLLADYSHDSRSLTIADTNPKKYTRFWTCAIERMHRACSEIDETAERARGMLVLRRTSPREATK